MTAGGWEHAIVVGSGMAGLAAARVLAEYFTRVTVLERDAAPEGAQPRPGVPQGAHIHGLLSGGLSALSELLPGLPDELVADGALRPGPDEFYFFRPEGKSYVLGGYLPVPPPDDGQHRIYIQSRALLEGCVRRRVAALDNVAMHYGARVEGISAEGRRVTGVRLAGGATIESDLVIDAMGRNGRTLQWLDQLGFSRPIENVITCDFAYTSAFMRPRRPDVFRDVGFFVMANTRARAATLVRIEDGKWLVGLGGSHGDYPPHEWHSFLEFAETAGEPLFNRLLAEADLISDLSTYRFHQSVRRRFDQLEHFPEGLLPLGDAVCHYNPVYGQGMSAACRQALALRQVLRERRANGESVEGTWRAFLPQAYQETRAPWLFAALADFRHPRCRGDFPEEERELAGILTYLYGQIAVGDMAALAVVQALSGLEAPLNRLREPPWPERAAAVNVAAAVGAQKPESNPS